MGYLFNNEGLGNSKSILENDEKGIWYIPLPCLETKGGLSKISAWERLDKIFWMSR